jgi:hypothetical protein
MTTEQQNNLGCHCRFAAAHILVTWFFACCCLILRVVAASYVDHFTYKNSLCIITDYCEHGDMYQFLQAKKQQQGQAQLPEAQVHAQQPQVWQYSRISASMRSILLLAVTVCSDVGGNTANLHHQH